VRLLCLALSLSATLVAEVDVQRRTAYPQLYALTELARSAAPEFAARGLLQLLEGQAFPDNDWQLEIAHEVLILAAAARHPVAQRLAPGITAADNRAMLWHVAYGQGLDRLSLSLRAIEHIRRLRPEGAKEAFIRLPRPVASQDTCKDAILDDVSAWFQMASRLQMDPLPLIESMTTHGEIAPAIDLIFSAGVLDLHAGALARKLRELPANDRPFNAALFHSPRKLHHLYMILTSQDRPAAALGDAFRGWMQAGLEAPACQESRVPGPQEQARRDAFNLFNESFEPKLALELLKPSGAPDPTILHPFAASESTREQERLFKRLLFGNNSRGLSRTEKDTPEWRESMQKFMQSIEGRTRSAEESDIEFFYRQSQLWAGVLMAAPAGPTRDRALNQYISLLLANAPHIDPLIWFSQVEFMAEVTRSLHGDEFAKTLTALHLTAHPALQLYAELESAYPSRPRVN